MHFTRLLLGLIISTSAMATDYRMVVTFVAGSQNDVVARSIQKSFERITNDQLVIENAPGADAIVGTVHYKNNKNIDIIGTSGTQIVFNPIVKKDLPYSDEDFDHAIYVGTAPGVYVTRPNTSVKTPNDLITNMPKFVGSYASAYTINVTALIKEKSVKTEIVSYKGSPEILVDIMNNTIDIGIMAINPTLIELVKSGKVSIVGSTYKDDITIDGIFIPSVPKRTGVTQFSGFVGIALRPGMEATRAEYLRKNLWASVNDPTTLETLKKLYILPDSSSDIKYIQKYYANYRNSVKSYLGN